jgi:hypothetical protein
MEFCQPLLINMDMERLLYGEGQTGDLVIEMRGPNSKARLTPELARKRARCQIVTPKGLRAGKARSPDRVEFDLKDLEAEGVALDQIPGVPLKLPLHVANNPRGSKQAEEAIPTEDRPEQVIKADKVIEVGMGHEDLAHAEEIAGRQGGDGTQIKEERTPRPPDSDVEGRVSPWAVDQLHLKGGFHPTT